MIKDATTYFLVSLWCYKFWLRNAIFGKIVPLLVGVLSLIELVGAVLHAFSFGDSLPVWIRISITGLLLLAASSLIYHHRRSRRRAQHLNAVVSSMMELCEAAAARRAARHHDSTDQRVVISDILDVVVFALEDKSKRPVMNASVVERTNPDDIFRIFVQDSRNDFDPGIELNPMQSMRERPRWLREWSTFLIRAFATAYDWTPNRCGTE